MPVAPHCNIYCAFCERRVCATLTTQHPGWAREVLSSADAAERVDQLVADHPDERFVVGVAGPGEPLANEETFDALRMIHSRHPVLLKCLSTNGLLLEDRLPELLEAGVSSVTVTINAPDGAVGELVYRWVRLDGRTYRGREAAELLVTRQFRGVAAALDAGLAVKVNTVVVPGVNDRHLVGLAERLRGLGVHIMNLMPLIPGGLMRNHRAPSCDEISAARAACGAIVPQFRLCEHCRADIVCFP